MSSTDKVSACFEIQADFNAEMKCCFSREALNIYFLIFKKKKSPQGFPTNPYNWQIFGQILETFGSHEDIKIYIIYNLLFVCVLVCTSFCTPNVLIIWPDI